SGGLGKHFPVVAIVAQILGAGFKNNPHQIIFLGRRLGGDNVTLLVKNSPSRARFRHVAAILAKGVTDFAHGAIAIVGIDIKQDRYSTRAIAFERKLFISRAGKLTRTAQDRPLDVIGRHVLSLGRQDGTAQARVGVGISAILGGDGDFL